MDLTTCSLVAHNVRLIIIIVIIIKPPPQYNHDQSLTSHMIVLGRLKLIPSMLGPGDDRHRGATGGNANDACACMCIICIW